MSKIITNRESFMELCAHVLWALMQRPELTTSADLAKLIGKIKDKVMTNFTTFWLNNDPANRVFLNRLSPVILGSAKSQHAIVIRPPFKSELPPEDSILKKAKNTVKKLLLKQDISISEYRLLCELLEFNPVNENLVYPEPTKSKDIKYLN